MGDLAAWSLNNLIDVAVAEFQSHVAIRTILVSVIGNVRVGTLEQQPSGYGILRFYAPPGDVLRASLAENAVGESVPEVWEAAVADTSSVDVPVEMLVEDHAPVFVSP